MTRFPDKIRGGAREQGLYYNLAKYHVEYSRIHKKAIEEPAQCKKEMRLTELDSECKPSTKERHALTKTFVLLNWNLSCVTNL